MKTPPPAFKLKSLFFSPLSLLIMAVTAVLSFMGLFESIHLFSLNLPLWSLVLLGGGVAELYYLLRTGFSEKFQNKMQREWSLKSLNQSKNELRQASKDYEKMRSRPNYQKARFERVRKLEKDMFEDFTRMEVWDNDIAQEVLSQSLKGFMRYYELLDRDQRVAVLLENANIQQIQEEIQRLRRQSASASTAEAAAQYERAAGFKQQELSSMERIRQNSVLLQAHLDTLESALSSLRTRLVNSTVWGGDSVRFELSNLTQELMALEMAMEELENLDDSVQEIEREL